MSIDLYWDNDEQTVMLAEFGQTWDWDELYAMLKTIKRLAAERGRLFGAIIDVREGLHIPGGTIFTAEALGQFRRMLALNQSGQKGPVVIVGVTGVVKTVFEAVKRIDKKIVQDVFFAETMEDARREIYAVMQQIDQDAASA